MFNMIGLTKKTFLPIIFSVTILIISAGCGRAGITSHSKKVITDISISSPTPSLPIGPASPPTLLNISPVSPSKTSTTPTLDGLATADTLTIKLFTSSACSTNEVGRGTKDEWESDGITITLTANTTSQIYVRAYDVLGNPSVCQNIASFQHDSNGPTPIDILSPESSTFNRVHQSPIISWSGGAIDAGVGFDHYEYSIGTSSGGTSVIDWSTAGISTSVTATALSLTPETTYYFNLRGVDLLGNLSTVSTTSWLTHAEELSLTPSSANLLPLDSQTFSVTGGYSPIIYALSSATGTINSTTGEYTAPNDAGSVVVYATDDIGTQASATINIAFVIAATTSSKTLATSEKYQFSATNGFPAYTWSITSGAGSIDSASGDYIAPLAANIATIRATDGEGYFDSISITTKEFIESDSTGIDIGLDFNARAITKDSLGNIYVAGDGNDGIGFPHWLVRKWNGVLWETIDDYTYNGLSIAHAESITVDSDNYIYVAGNATDPMFPRWIIRKWDGSSWVTLDNYQLATDRPAYATNVASDGSGNIFATGYATDSSYYSHLIVKKWDGSSWTIIDDYQYVATKDAFGNALIVDQSGNVYVSGGARDGSNYLHWITRKWNGTTWTTVDDYQLAATKAASGGALAQDGETDIYVTGGAIDGTGITHLITRKWDGSTWTTIDDYQLVATKLAYGNSITRDLDGNIYTTGCAIDASNYQHWITRKWNGLSWSTIDDYQQTIDTSAFGYSVFADTSGKLYSAGAAEQTVGQTWIVKEWDGAIWTIIDNYQGAGHKFATVSALVQDESENIYASGYLKDYYSYDYWTTRKWDGSSWTTIDSYQLAATKEARARAVTYGGSGNVYVAGSARDASNYYHWIVRKWDGSAWATVDNYQLVATKTSIPDSIVQDGSGNIYVGGNGSDSSGYIHWIVRKWNGSVWSTIQDYQTVATKPAYATALAFDGSGNLYAAGYARDASNYFHWIVQKWDGSIWTNVDDYQLETTKSSIPHALLVMGVNNIYAVGYATDLSNYNHWITRKWDGSTWATVDDYQLIQTKNSTANAITQDNSGNIYVAGVGINASDLTHWVVRKWNGQYWSTIRDYDVQSSLPYRFSEATSLTHDPINDIIYAGGQRFDGWSYDWYVEKLP
ncbi:MAG: hypothetical protein A2504_04095 [Bdellovibrionales bacterium RIFOXYD12_FULL_39_22]|nr:MAG: hypothetical protein A2385_11845 [Bdellovibrionales bacterium RIFOXYB1_FULL_39_21]OFZ41754.1 MAG: hypothetical protein A2485_02155 [Bdellovibrionales bacterium RIFOXYC12_FULL_39_17]OFZ46154.1 MAG: hypothetical protein A2404_12520 [Bdellovibrionales bacterium RIFOXYC1_FULL_39_130]OFZ74980.1 MAG: hypothetical protein A2560_15560 [Bdellovibrionales bacterium RIFOXYD1_FULL_39_84]OFZ76253.1 MAG: hypothetical protein A2451_05400 [Bdellovibrionales bacterium RIFOXYC2_FULL_39_8]OFZ92833.1 MAG: